jgi:hypothetical protein
VLTDNCTNRATRKHLQALSQCIMHCLNAFNAF